MHLTHRDSRATSCTLCGRAAASVWSGEAATIAVCRECASTTLPILIADSLHLRHDQWTVDQARDTLAKVEAGYWKAVALRALRERGAT